MESGPIIQNQILAVGIYPGYLDTQTSMNVIFLVKIGGAVRHSLFLNLTRQIVGYQGARINVVLFVAYHGYISVPIYPTNRLNGSNRRSTIADYYVVGPGCKIM